MLVLVQYLGRMLWGAGQAAVWLYGPVLRLTAVTVAASVFTGVAVAGSTLTGVSVVEE